MLMATSAWAEWTYFIEGEDGDVYLIDYDNIERSDNDLIYFWFKSVHKAPNELGDITATNFFEVSCNAPRKYKPLVYRGVRFNSGGSYEITPPDKWLYPLSGSITRSMINRLCD